MHSAFTTFVRRATKVTAVVACLGAWFAGGQAARAGISVTQNGSTLSIVGNNYNNYVALVGGKETPYGEVGVRTNPNSDTFVPYEDVEDIEIHLQGGDNLLVMERIRILGDLAVTAGDGENVVLWGEAGYGSSVILGNAAISTGEGRDWLTIEDTYVDGVVGIDTAGGNDVVILDYILILVGNYVDAQAPQRSTDRDLVAATEPVDGRTADVEGPTDLKGSGESADPPSPSNSFGSLIIFTGDGSDYVGIHSTEVEVETTIELEGEDDRLYLVAPDQFFGSFVARGGQGQDYLFDSPTNYYESNPHFQSFELP